ncbi:hypothetical protein E2C01_015113 [Portunus trituberculatus]|uniref:Uncharacterized protein n=1 Tax=Portunus trituberculatus TaxID=210409 RepID=A0A5B7DLV1_PORTR|nr:hypothetical protein [Portunus trituberculatus]
MSDGGVLFSFFEEFPQGARETPPPSRWRGGVSLIAAVGVYTGRTRDVHINRCVHLMVWHEWRGGVTAADGQPSRLVHTPFREASPLYDIQQRRWIPEAERDRIGAGLRHPTGDNSARRSSWCQTATPSRPYLASHPHPRDTILSTRRSSHTLALS